MTLIKALNGKGTFNYLYDFATVVGSQNK